MKRRAAVYNNVVVGISNVINGMKKLGLNYAEPEVEVWNI
jgi:hypothetical protein